MTKNIASVVFDNNKLKITLFINLRKKDSFNVAADYVYGMRELIATTKRKLDLDNRAEIILKIKHGSLHFPDRTLVVDTGTIASKSEYEEFFCDVFVDLHREIALESHMRGFSLA